MSSTTCTTPKKSIGFALLKNFDVYDAITAFCYKEKINYEPVYECDAKVFRIYLFSLERAIKVINFIKKVKLNALFVNITDN